MWKAGQLVTLVLHRPTVFRVCKCRTLAERTYLEPMQRRDFGSLVNKLPENHYLSVLSIWP